MRRLEIQPARPTAGCIPVPLFNQKKRNRVPLTSAPSVNEFFSHGEFMAGNSSASSLSIQGPYADQAPGPSGQLLPSQSHQSLLPSQSHQSLLVSQSHQWSRQDVPQSTQPRQYEHNRPAPGPAATGRVYTPVPHPYKAAGTSCKTGQPSYPVRKQDPSPMVTSRQNKYPTPPSSERAQTKLTSHAGFSQMGQQSSYRSPNPTHQYVQQTRPPCPPPAPPASVPSARPVQPRNNSWKFTNSFGPQTSSFEGKRSSNQPQTARPTRTQPEPSKMKPAPENSLRILTAVIDGMRHWSQFKDKVPYLFEIFATLDSAVTLGRHGAKTFLVKDGKEALQCVYYENEQELPRFIRGQIHRCVGNYDRSRDVLMCVSIRPALPSELRNAHEAVKACDAEMRALAKSLNED